MKMDSDQAFFVELCLSNPEYITQITRTFYLYQVYKLAYDLNLNEVLN
jgi:hypothetical protein